MGGRLGESRGKSKAECGAREGVKYEADGCKWKERGAGLALSRYSVSLPDEGVPIDGQVHLRMTKPKPPEIKAPAVSVALVDDHAILLEGLRLRLAAEPGLVLVGQAADAAGARILVGAAKPDVLVMDVHLPGESGLSLTRWFRAKRPGLRILLLTGSTDAALAAESLQAGAHGFMLKSGGADELVGAIRALACGENYFSPAAAAGLVRGWQEIKMIERLTPQERKVLGGIAEGLTYKEIALRLGIGARSVETYRARLALKTGCRSKVELARFAARMTGREGG